MRWTDHKLSILLPCNPTDISVIANGRPILDKDVVIVTQETDMGGQLNTFCEREKKEEDRGQGPS